MGKTKCYRYLHWLVQERVILASKGFIIRSLYSFLYFVIIQSLNSFLRTEPNSSFDDKYSVGVDLEFSHVSLFASNQPLPSEEVSQSHLHRHHRKTLADALTGPLAEWHESELIVLVLMSKVLRVKVVGVLEVFLVK